MMLVQSCECVSVRFGSGAEVGRGGCDGLRAEGRRGGGPVSGGLFRVGCTRGGNGKMIRGGGGGFSRRSVGRGIRV